MSEKTEKHTKFCKIDVEKCSEMLYNESSWGSLGCLIFHNFQSKGQK